MKACLLAILFVAACSSSNETGTDAATGSHCGNGLLENGETCDDGNTASGDGCSSTCQIESVCGDGEITGSEQCDDGNTTDGDGCSSACLTEYKTTARWHIENAAGTAQPCPPGYDTAAVYSQLLDSNGNPSGSPSLDLFDCAAGTGTTALLGNGVFRTWIAITNPSGTQTYAQTLSADLDLTAMNMLFDGDIITDGGYFHWAWNLVGATSNSALTCAQVTGIEGVEITSTVTSSTTSFTDQFTCTDGEGTSAALPAGSYTVSADAFSNASALGTAPALTNKIIQSPNNVTDLGTITLPIDGM